MTGYFLSREELERIESDVLAPYAVHNRMSRGRTYPEVEHPYRTAFQRDRDRIIHSAAFRRLKNKTQVFALPHDDHFRTRLTHTMEVAQISRTIAKALRLNEELAEAIALVHDLGHTPFGHAGEAALSEILKDSGGFNHNIQSLRVVDYLEDRYPDFIGLNLTWEVREGIVKHETDYDLPSAACFDPQLRAPLEGQLVNLADEIAYNAHDVDDAYFARIITWDDLLEVPLLQRLHKESVEKYPDLNKRKRHYHLVRLLINWAVSDLVASTVAKLRDLKVESLEDIVTQDENIASFSADTDAESKQLKVFLMQRVYRHPDLVETNDRAKRMVTDLFRAYCDNHRLLSDKFIAKLEHEDELDVVKDYIAGMSDSFALEQYRKILG